MWIYKVASIFSNQATFTKHCNLQVRSYIFSFWFFAFFQRKWYKNASKIRYQKTSKKHPRRVPKVTPNGPEFAKNHQKYSKYVKKSWYLRYQFFIVFFWAKKTIFLIFRIPLDPENLTLRGKRKAQFGIWCYNAASCCYPWKLVLQRCPLLYSVVLCCATLCSAVLCCALLCWALLCCCLLLVAAGCCWLLLVAASCCWLLLFDAGCC